jgi:uncharacterized membrane protein YeaQ/YmgE (transglycosylase-associated protein family)
MGILLWIVVGLIAGWLAGLVTKGSGYGILGDVILGVVGALLGGFVATRFFGLADPISGFNITTILIAFIGAVVIVVVVGALRGGTRRAF